MSLRCLIYIRKSNESEDRQVLSIPAQEEELTNLKKSMNLVIVGEPIIEAKSAKQPGRPGFNMMMEQINSGKADAIICWHLDRLARNPVDGGSIIWALGEKTIQKIITPVGSYTGTSDTKFMMSVIFGMATKYSDDLSANVLRGNKKALNLGLWINRPKLGYIRDRDTREIIPDPKRFDLVKEMWRLRIAGTPTLKILQLSHEWGLVTPRRRTMGGKTLSVSQIYRIFSDPFYAGIMLCKGETYEGKHQPMISRLEYEKVQNMMQKNSGNLPKPKWHNFTYRGMLHCGLCGAMVTAENTTNRHGKKYVYYHCCRKNKKYGYCEERSIEEKSLEEQVEFFIKKLILPQKVINFTLKQLEKIHLGLDETLLREEKSLRGRLVKIEQRLVRLRELFVDNEVTKDEYKEDREKWLKEKYKVEENLENIPTTKKLIEPLYKSFSLLNKANFDFHSANSEEKRTLLKAVSSNLVLRDKKVLIEAKKPFSLYTNFESFPKLCTWWEHVRTPLVEYAFEEALKK